MAEAANNDFDGLPAEWETVRLGDVATLASGGTPSKKRPDFWIGRIPWASPKDLKMPWLYDTQDHISQEGLEDGSRLVSAGSLFVVVRGMILAKDVPVSMAMVPMAFNQDMKAIAPNGGIDGAFLLYAFTKFKSRLVPEIGSSAHGTRRIGTQAIEHFQFPLPPLPEQKAIAHLLRTVQRAKEATEKVIAATRQLKLSLMRHLFTYGPVPFHDADKVELKETEDSITFPAHWSDSTVADVADLKYGYCTSIPKMPPKNGVDIVSTAEITSEGQLRLDRLRSVEMPEHLVERYTVEKGDILFNWRNSQEHVGKTAIVESAFLRPTVLASFIIRIRNPSSH